jgi:hypothetical protein
MSGWLDANTFSFNSLAGKRKMEQMMEGDLAGVNEVLKALLSLHAVLHMLQLHYITTFFR